MRMPYLIIAALIALACSAMSAEELCPPVDEEFSDEEILRAVDASRPGLEDFAAAMEAGNFERATELLAVHFATRGKPFLPEAQHPAIAPGDSSMTLYKGQVSRDTVDNMWLKHTFTYRNYYNSQMETYDLGPEIKWLYNPSDFYGWMAQLHQMNFIAQMAGIYQQTGDDKYAAEIGRLLVSWTKQTPRNISGHIEDHDRVASVNIFMQVRNRTCNALAAYDAVRKSPALTPQMHMAFWKLFIGNCRYLVPWSEGRGVVTYPALFGCGALLPEFTERTQWIDAGRRNIEENLVDRVTPDGAWDTHSVSYNPVPIPWALRVLEILEANPDAGDFTDIADMIASQSKKMIEIMLWQAMPNAGTPCIGDIYGRSDWTKGFVNEKTRWYMASYLTPKQRERLEAIPDTYARLKALLAIAEGTSGNEPHTTSIGFPATGYYTMRQSWESAQTPYMYYDLSPIAGSHSHMDTNHFELYAYGKPLIVDTGDYFLGWGVRTCLHNTIEIDGQMQKRYTPVLPCEWLTSSAFDYIDGTGTHYDELNVRHRRKMLFLKEDSAGIPAYWIMADVLTGEGSHTYEQFFHFAGPTQTVGAVASIDPDTLTCTTENQDVANVIVAPVNTAGLSANFAEAVETDMDWDHKEDREAMLGWLVTDGTYSRVKSPVAVYTRQGEPPISYYDVLFPMPERATANITPEALPVTQDGAELAPTDAAAIAVDCEITRPRYRDDEISVDMGDNLAAGKTVSGEVNEGALGSSGASRLTDSDLASRDTQMSWSSSPYVPGTPLEGRFTVDFAQPTTINAIVCHHGTWNGSKILYIPEEMTIQYWNGDTWTDVTDVQTQWGDEGLSQSVFAPIQTARISITVKRPSGGRIAMREIAAHDIPTDQLARAQQMRTETVLQAWTDYYLISHAPATTRSYGDFTFDGELAVVRTNSAGDITRILIKHGTTLTRGGQPLVTSTHQLTTFSADWSGDTVTLDTFAPHGITLLRNGASRVLIAGDEVPAQLDAQTITLPAVNTLAPVEISDAAVELHPAQKGLGAGQPFATVTWKTNVPATSRVEFSASPDLIRRTFVDAELTTDHSVRVDFLCDDTDYKFTCISMDEFGNMGLETVD